VKQATSARQLHADQLRWPRRWRIWRDHQRIFIGDGGTYTNSVTLNSNGWLIGRGVTGASFDALFRHRAAGAGHVAARPSLNLPAPTISVAAAATVQSTSAAPGLPNAVRGVNLVTGSATTKAVGVPDLGR
jgi:hypothetical protein